MAEQAAPAEPAAAPVEQGYFSALGATFRTDFDQITKNYKKLALKYHPDKNPSQEAADTFHRITTSYHILADEEKRKNYLRLFLLRCYMSQERPTPGGPLRPYYAFMVEKSKYALGGKTDRLLTFDLLEHTMHSFKKDKEQKQFPLAALAPPGVHKGEGSLDITLNFKKDSGQGHPYYLRCRCQEQYDTLLEVVRRVAACDALGDEALGVLVDDATTPPSSVHKSKVIKRAEKLGSSLVHDWQPRFMVMGSTQLVIFRDVDLSQMVNILPLSVLKLHADAKDRTCFQLTTPGWKASFRVLDVEIANRWASSLAECKAANLAAALHAAANGGKAPPPGKQRAARPSLFFFQKDLAAMAGGPLLALPAPELAPSEVELPHGWMQYRDDEGNQYYFNSTTNETCWELPAGVLPLAGGGAPPAVSPDELIAPPSSKETDDVKRQQLAALRDEGEASDAALAEAKASLISTLAAMERSIAKAKKGLAADRPIHDLAPLFEGLRTSFEKVVPLGAEYEKQWVVRDEHQRTFMQNRGNYLDGLQSHVLGDAQPSADSRAAAIFRKAAYVADTFQRAPIRTVL